MTRDDDRVTRNPASAVHGTVLVGALIAAQGSHDPVDVWNLVVLVLATLVVYWLAHVYAEVIGQRIETGRRPRWRQVRHLLREEWPLVAASFVPLVSVALVYLLGGAANTAVLAGLWVNTAVLVGWALVAGLRSHLRPLELMMSMGLSGVIGLGLIGIKVLLH